MSTPSGFLRGSRALFAAARSAAATPKPTAPPSSTKKPAAATPSKSPVKKKSTNSGITKSIPVSLALQNFVGAPEVSRVEAVKKVWAYIKENNLQNPLDKRVIFCDAKLKKIFDGKDKVGFLEIAKLLSPHFVKTG